MERYIGTKVIQAEPRDRQNPNTNVTEAGYKVVYPDGYTSWSPKETFEAAYRRLTEDELALLGAPPDDVPEIPLR